MDTIPPHPTIVEQAYQTILDAICEGRLEPGERLTQESVAAKLSVSRQPVGQALLLLKQQKFVTEAGRRGLMVAPLDREFMLRAQYVMQSRTMRQIAGFGTAEDTNRRFKYLIAQGQTGLSTDFDMKSRSSGATISPRRPASLTNFCCFSNSSAWPTGCRDTDSFCATDSCVRRSPGVSRPSQMASRIVR